MSAAGVQIPRLAPVALLGIGEDPLTGLEQEEGPWRWVLGGAPQRLAF